MSQPVSSQTEPQQPVPQPEPAPESHSTVAKAAMVAVAFFVAIIAVASTGIGFTLAPFSPEVGGAALAFGASMFALAGYLFYTGTRSSPDLESRSIRDVL
jgi:hypothetical protein